MKPIFSISACALTLLANGTAQSADWVTIGVDAETHADTEITAGGVSRSVSPACALGGDFEFHFKNGKQDKLVVYFAEGGACWDSETCIGSLDENGDLNIEEESDQVYIATAEKADNPEGMGGLFKLDDPSNPYADWSMLFIPNCTGDVHIGSRDMQYEPIYYGGVLLYDGMKIHHRGLDNFLFAMTWLKTEHPEIDPGKILVAGSSAGAYGAPFNYPWVREFYPDADKVFLVSDSGAGVLTSFDVNDTEGLYSVNADGFLNAAFGGPESPSVWNVKTSLHWSLQGALRDYYESGAPFIPAVWNRLRADYPKDKFAQYTTAYDAVQVLFWEIMLNPYGAFGAGPFVEDFRSAWNIAMGHIIADQQATLPDNYRSYIAPGCNHSILGLDDDFYASSLNGANNETISFLQWLSAMTGGKGADKQQWQNLTCSSEANDYDCGEDSLAIDSCILRSFSPPSPM